MFFTGGQVTKQGIYPEQPAAEAAFAENYAEHGFNCIESWFNPPEGARAVYKRCAITAFRDHYFLANGYRIGAAPKPDSAAFITRDGSVMTEGIYKRRFYICPTEVYRQGDYFRSQVIPMLEKELKGGDDHFMPNHEPFPFSGKGCFCRRCRKEYEDYLRSGRLSPSGENWTSFRSWQHGQVLKTMEEVVNSIGRKIGRDAHFIPELNWAQFDDSSQESFMEYRARDFMTELPIVNVWGPYLFHKYREPYRDAPGIHLAVFVSAQIVRDFLKRHIPDPSRRPQLIAFPHCFQGEDWITSPEEAAFETLCFFLSGYRGSLLYLFRNVDYAYYAEMAKANAMIAQLEEIVMKELIYS